MITYKNITDVEVLEQASENTKVLVNEGGELMQAPYSNFEDKMKDAEVLEEIPENAMALVNDGGKLKQVSCGAFTSAALILDENDGNYSCENMTYEEAREILEAKKPLIIMVRSLFGENCYNFNFWPYRYYSNEDYIDLDGLEWSSAGFTSMPK